MRHAICLVLLVLAAPVSHAGLVNVTPYYQPDLLLEQRTGAFAYAYSSSINVDAACYDTSNDFVFGPGTAEALVGGGSCGISTAIGTLAMAISGNAILADGHAASTTTGRPAAPATGIDSVGYSTVNLAFEVDQTSPYSLTALFSGFNEEKQGNMTYAHGYGRLVLYEDGLALHDFGSQDLMDAAMILTGVELSGVLTPGREYRLFAQYMAFTRNNLLEGRSQSGEFHMQFAVVPVPPALLTMGGALIALFACRRREKRAT